MTAGGVTLRWVRTGLGAAVTQPVAEQAPARPSLPLSVRLHRDGGEVGRVEPTGLALLGPGDVTGLDPRQVVGCWPPPDSAGVTAADLAHIELADPPIPWLVSPFAADPAGNLVPWLALAVVSEATATVSRVERLLVLEVPGSELPRWSQLHAWIHVHVADPSVDVLDQAALRAALERPGTATVRLICPRRLASRTTYLACLVPTFKAGADTALGHPAPTSTATPAWTADPAAVRLPVYWSWRFTTGEAATVEDLALALRPASDSALSVGATRRLAVDQAGRDLPASEPLPIGGALRVGTSPVTPVYDATALATARTTTAELPTPTWGDWHAEATDGEPPDWLADLNDWPPHRVVAGLGAAAIRTHQEQLMAAAWEQAGQWSETDEQLRHAQAALTVNECLWSRRLAPLIATPAALLQITGPAAARLVVAADTPRSLTGRLATTCLPPTLLAAPARRLVRPAGKLARRLAATRDGMFRRREVIEAFIAGPPTHAPDPGPEKVRTLSEAPPPPAAEPHVIAAIDAWLAGAAASIPTGCQVADLEALAQAATDALDPRQVLPGRVHARIAVHETPVTTAEPGERISRLRVGPRLDVPLFDLLLEHGVDWILPGVASLPDDQIVLAEPDPTVIEAFLVGANHEMARELLWRRYPADRGTSVFTRFWDRAGGSAAATRDVPDLHNWQGKLGGHLVAGARIAVVAARGRLFRDHPDLLVYAHRATQTQTGVRPIATADDAAWNDRTVRPVFTGRIPPDVVLFGFPLNAATLRGQPPDPPGWFVVFAEPPVGTRFGLAQTPKAGTLDTWADLSWEDITLIDGSIDATSPPTRSPAGGPVWAARSDVLAAIIRRAPFRLFIHASRLLPAA